MRHIHKKIVICAALAAFPLVLTASTYATESSNNAVTEAYNSITDKPFVSMPQDDIQVSGRIIDEEGNPLVGVSVVMQNSYQRNHLRH